MLHEHEDGASEGGCIPQALSLYPEEFLLEGAGADPSQRIGTRLGGVVSSRDCRLFLPTPTHNTGDPVGASGKTLTN